MKPWEETWTAEPEADDVARIAMVKAKPDVYGPCDDEPRYTIDILEAWERDYHDCVCGMTRERATLAAAAPAMARALCLVEWRVEREISYEPIKYCVPDKFTVSCASCGKRYEGFSTTSAPLVHEPGCSVAAALSAAGLDAAAREAVRQAAAKP